MTADIGEIQKSVASTPTTRLFTRQHQSVATTLATHEIYTPTWELVEANSETYDARQASYEAYHWVARRVCERLGVTVRPMVWCDERFDDPNRRTTEHEVFIVLDVPTSACVAIDSSKWYGPLNGSPIIPGNWNGPWADKAAWQANDREYDRLAHLARSSKESLEASWETIFDVSDARYGVEYLLTEIRPEWIVAVR